MSGTRRLLYRIVLSLSLLPLGISEVWSQTRESLLVEQPSRAFGYFIGDVLQQRIYHRYDDARFGDAGLNEPRRVSNYLLRSPVVQQSGKRASGERQRWLEIRYQVINAPGENLVTSIPALKIAREAGPDIDIPEWSFSISPLLVKADDAPVPEQIRADIAALQAVPLYSSRPMKISSAVLFSLLSLWLLWWLFRHFRDQRILPFARARKLIKRADRHQDSEGWVALHRAFNFTAGKSINQSNIDELIAAAPWLSPLRAAIDEFYQQSAERFYRQSGALPKLDIAQLSDQLFRCERAHAGSRH